MLCAVEIYTKRLLALKEELFHVSSENGGIHFHVCRFNMKLNWFVPKMFSYDKPDWYKLVRANWNKLNKTFTLKKINLLIVSCS